MTIARKRTLRTSAASLENETSTASSTTRLTAKKAQTMKLLQLIESVCEGLHESGLTAEAVASVKVPANELAKRFSLTPTQTMLFCCYVAQFSDPRINVSDIARYFRCSQVRVFTMWEDVLVLRDKGLIRMSNEDGNEIFQVPSPVMIALRANEVYVKPSYENLTQEQFLARLGELHTLGQGRAMSTDDLVREIEQLMKDNKHVPFASEVGKAGLDDDALIILVATAMMLVEEGDEHIIAGDVEDLFERRQTFRYAMRQISANEHQLQRMKYIEPALENGMANLTAWHLTDEAKRVLLPGVKLMGKTQKSSQELRQPDTIVEKRLYFRQETQEQVNRLRHIFSEEHFKKVQERLESRGMRRGMACIFYGGPGTGKTELVHQLAKETGRAIMLVDISQMRDKFVGETEKQIKNVFDRYRNYVKEQPVAPILVFNEADALFCNRNSNATTGVDKMENAMQNIILQEMETLDGILIATTNLAESMDSAFERRFLYKVEFQNPGPEEAVHIWQTMLPELQDTDAMALAKQYRFSGGQIENIARKQLVNSILLCDEQVDYSDMLSQIEDACKQEQFRRKGSTRMGFAG